MHRHHAPSHDKQSHESKRKQSAFQVDHLVCLSKEQKMSHARLNAKLQQQSADSAAARQSDAVSFARALVASTDSAESAAAVENELRHAYPDLDAATVLAIARETPLLLSPPQAQVQRTVFVSPPSPIVVHVPSSSSNTAVLSDFASASQAPVHSSGAVPPDADDRTVDDDNANDNAVDGVDLLHEPSVPMTTDDGTNALSTPQKRTRRAAAPTDLSESAAAKRARTTASGGAPRARSHSAARPAKSGVPVTTPTKTSAVGGRSEPLVASEDGARVRALRSPQPAKNKPASSDASRHRDGALAAWVPTKASLVVCADDEFSTRWTDGLPSQFECWCSKAFADAAAFQAHKCNCDVGLRGFLGDSVLAFADSAQKTMHERLETVSHGYIRRFHWGVPHTPSADADAAVQHHLARQYHLMIRHADAMLFAMHPDAEEFAIRHKYPLAAKAKPTAAAARKAAAAAAAVVENGGDNADDVQELGKSSAFLLATDLLLIGAMIRSNVITTSLQMRFMLANLVASVRFTFGPESRRYELVRKIVDHVDLSLVQEAEAARGREWSERLFVSGAVGAAAGDDDRASASAPVAVPVAAALDGDDGEPVLDGEIPPLGSNAPIAFGALRDVRRLKPIVDGPVDPADSRALKALLRELRPAQLLGQRRLRDALSEELARQPARPHRNAPAKEWRLYAQALERINAAYSVLKRFVGA
jgi:hypothetical protein